MKTTIGMLVVAYLSLDTCPADEQIIEGVLARFPESRIDRSHLAWYKTKYRTGYYTGANETINQPIISTKTSTTKANRTQDRINNLKMLVNELKKTLKS